MTRRGFVLQSNSAFPDSVKYALNAISFCLFLILLPENVQAESLLEVVAQLEHIENPQRRLNGNDEDLLYQVGINGGYEQETKRFDSALNYQLRKWEYKNDSIQDRDTLTGNGVISLKILPDTLSWNLSNSRTFQTIDAVVPDNPDNRQVVNITSTGPSLSTRIGAKNRINTRLNYSLADYETINSFSQSRSDANVDFTHIFSMNLLGSIRAGYLKSDYDTGDTLDFERKSFSIQGILSRENYSLSMEFGENEIKRQFQSALKYDLIKLDGNYQINSSSNITLGYSRSGEDMLSNILLFPGDSAGNADTPLLGSLGNSNRAQFFELERTSFNYAYTMTNSFRASIDYTSMTRSFDDINNNQEDERISLQATWPISPKLNLTFFGRETDLFFFQNARIQERHEIGFTGRYKLNDSFSFNLSVQRTEQESNVERDNFNGLNAFVAVFYRH